MAKPTVHIIKLVSVSFVVIVCFMCQKPENKNPCGPMPWGPGARISCLPRSPSNGAIVSPTNRSIIWITADGSTSSLYFGTDKDNLPCISQQSAFSYELKNLDFNTTYYWYLKAEHQCAYGCTSEIYSFTTVPDTNLPYVITAPVSTHINTPPRVGGNVVFEGSSELSERGIYFGHNSNPEIGGTKFQIGNGTDIFSDFLPGLNSNTTYYVKAYATNKSGTVYGSEVSFTTGQVSDYKFIKDIEGNIYYIINIGKQVWMAENLRTTSFNDGTLISNITDDITWKTIKTPAYCWYNNHPGFKSTYGALYNWYTIDSASNGHKNVCPTGWHVPSNNEWASLTSYLGGNLVAGIKLSEAGDFYWSLSGRAGGDNSSDFSALGGGMRYSGFTTSPDGSLTEFSGIGFVAIFWSTDSSLNVGGSYLSHNGLYIDHAQTAEDFTPEFNNGHSVRCIQDTI
jgi:uncharacterized protein (TIGR02145 family)